MPKVEELIISRDLKRGDDTPESPVRFVLQVFTKEGDIIASDGFWDNYTMEEMLSFGKTVQENPGTDILELFKKMFDKSY